MREIVVVRHGQSTGNAQGIAQGRLGYPLTERGIEDVRCAAARIAESGWEFTHYVSSPVQRCVESSGVLREVLEYPEFSIDEAFTEIDCGSATGRTYRDVMKEHPEFFGRSASEWLGFGELGGESNLDLVTRVGNGLDAYEDEAKVLLMTHGGVFKAVLAHLLGIPTNFYLDLHYASVMRLVRKRIGSGDIWAWSHYGPPAPDRSN